MRRARQDNATIQSLSFKLPFTDITVDVADSFTIGYVNFSSTGDKSGVVGETPSFGASFDISFDAPEDPTPVATVGLGKNLGVGTFRYEPRIAGTPDKPRLQYRSTNYNVNADTLMRKY